MASEAWPWKECLETEGLCLGGLDYLPHINPKLFKNLFQFIDQRNINCSIGVLKHLARLGHFARRNRNNLADSAAV